MFLDGFLLVEIRKLIFMEQEGLVTATAFTSQNVGGHCRRHCSIRARKSLVAILRCASGKRRRGHGLSRCERNERQAAVGLPFVVYVHAARNLPARRSHSILPMSRGRCAARVELLATPSRVGLGSASYAVTTAAVSRLPSSHSLPKS